MPKLNLNKRSFLQWMAASFIASQATNAFAMRRPQSLKVAALQMNPKLADVDYNLTQADQLIKQAINQGAQWIILPEFFSTGIAFHTDILETLNPINNAPLELLKKHAKQSNITIGGSFLTRDGDDIYNRFHLVFPDGSTQQHNKNLPTYWENCYYKSGNDDGILNTPIGDVGAALCWEFIRSNTAKRLKNKVNLVVGGSCWWTLPDDVDSDSPFWDINQKMLRDAAPNMAKMLGVPVINASHTGKFEAFYSPELEDVEYNSSYLGETMIVNHTGHILARRTQQQGAGIIMAVLNLNHPKVITSDIPERFWLPEEMPLQWKESWLRWFDVGQDYYQEITQPYLITGEINEYTPKYMR